MKRLTNSRKMMAVLGAGLLVAAASGTAFAMQTREGHELRSTIEVQQKASERHGQPPTPTFASPLPTPTLSPTAEPHAEIEFTGQVEVIASDMWVVGGRTLLVTADTEIKPGLAIGDQAKVHAVTQADGTLLAREIEPASGDNNNGNSNDNENSNDDNSNDNHNGNVNSNDNNGNFNSNENSNDDNSNDNHDGNSNGNSNDGHGNDNHNCNDNHGGNHNGNGNHGNGNHG